MRLTTLFLLGLGLLTPVLGQTDQWIELGLDTDNDSTTGCSWVLEDGTVVTGIELVSTTRISRASGTPEVVSVTFRRCNDSGLGPSQPLDGGYPVAVNQGLDGGDAVEAYIPLALFGVTNEIRIVGQARNDTGAFDIINPGAPVVYNLPFVTPTLGQWGLIVLCLLLMALGVWYMRKGGPGGRRAALVGIAAVMLVGFTNLIIIIDGNIDDWDGATPLVFDDLGDVGDDDVDLIVCYVCNDDGNLYWRCDVVDNENTDPVPNDLKVTTNEDTPVDITLTALDLEDPDLDFAIDQGPSNGSLSALSRNVSTAMVTYTPDADYFGPDSFTYTVTDDQGVTATATVDITVDSVNDEPSFTVGADQTVLEDAGAQTVAGFINDGDGGPDNESDNLTFSITNNTNAALFAAGPAVSSDGTLTYTPADDANGSAVISLTVSDDDGTLNGGDDTSDPQSFTITVDAVNDAPTFTALGDISVSEDAGPQTIDPWAKSISPGPADEAGQAVTFAVVNDNNALFATQPAVSADGILTFEAQAGANGTAQVTVTAMDDGGTANGGDDTADDLTFTLSVDSVNDVPTFTVGADQTLDEDAGAQTIVDWITDGNPIEPDQTLTYNIVSNSNPGLFAAGPAVDADGTLTYTTVADANGSAVIEIELMDDGGTMNGGDDTSDPQSFNVTVTALNDPPTFDNLGNQDVLEDAGPQTVPAWASNISPGPADENGQTVSFNLTNDNNGLFSSQPALAADGTLTFEVGAGNKGVAIVTVSAMDDGGTPNGGDDTADDVFFTISVGAVNDPPTFTVGADQTSNEDAGLQNVAGFIADGDPIEVGQTITYMVTNDNNGLFATQPAIDAAGNLTYTAALNANGSSVVTVVAMDDGGTADGGQDTSPSQTFDINVTAVNDAPTFDNAGNQDVLEDAGPQSVPAWATNISPGPTDEAAQNVSFNVSNDNNALFSSQPAIAADGTLTFEVGPGNKGASIVTVSAMDDGGTANGGDDTADDVFFTISVGAVNDPPTFTVGADQTSNEDAGAQTVMTFIADGDTIEAGQTISYMVSNDNNALFNVQPAIDASGTLTYTAAADANGTTTVTVVAMDDGGTADGGQDTSAPQDFNLTVTAVNDVPSFTKGPDQTVNEDSGAVRVSRSVVGWATAISTGPTDESGQTVSFNVSNDNNALFAVQPTVNPGGDLDFTPAGDAFGTATVAISISDDGGTANGGVDTSADQTFTITIDAVNDEPTFTVGADQTVNEDSGAQNVMTFIADGDPIEAGQTLSYMLSNDNNGLFLAQPAIDASGNLTYTPAADANGSATVTVTAMDDGGTANGGDDTSPSQNFTINVTAVNDAPSFTVGADESILEDAGAQLVNGWATGLSEGPADESGQTLSFNITGNTNAALFAAGPAVDASGNLTYTPAADAFGTATVTVNIMDDGGTANGGVDTSAGQTFDITITNINDEPSFTAGADQNYSGAAVAQNVMGWATGISAGPNEGAQTLTFNITGNTNAALFDAGPAVDGTTGDLTFTPATGASGTATITLALMDNGGTANGGDDTSPTQTFDITVTALNMEPTFTAGGDENILEDAGAQNVAAWATAIDDGDGGAQVLTFMVTNDNNALFDVQPDVDEATGNLTYTPAADANGTAVVSVTLTDDGGTAGGGDDTSPTAMFNINITAVNDEPSFTAGANETVNEDAGAQNVMNWATSINAGAANEGGQTLTFNITGNTNAGLFSAGPAIDSSGNLTYTSAANAFGVATITVELSDDGGTANGGDDTSSSTMFTITVNSVNDPPSTMADSSYETLPHVALNVALAGGNQPSSPFLTSTFGNVLANDTDIEMDPLSVTTIVGSGDLTEPFVGTTTQGGTVTMYADGSFLYEPQAGDTNVADTFSYTVTDGTTPANETVTITIENTDPIWFINDTAAGGGDGTSNRPFNTIADFNGSAADAGDRIFVSEGNTGTTPLTGSITLAANQILHGEGVALSVTHPEDASTPTLIAAGNKPTIQGAGATTVVTMASGATIQGLELETAVMRRGVTGPFAIEGTMLTNGTISNVDITNESTDRGIGISNSQGTWSIDTVSLSGGSLEDAVNLANNSGTFTFNNLTATNYNTGVRIDPTAGGAGQATYTFNGTTTITNPNNAFVVENGGAATDADITIANISATSTGLDGIKISNTQGDFTITGGSVTAGGSSTNIIDLATMAGRFNASGATFTSTMGGTNGVVISQTTGQIDIGTLDIRNQTSDGIDISGMSTTSTINITSATLNGNGGVGIDIQDGAPALTITSLDLDQTAGTGINLNNIAGSFTVTGGDINHSGGRFMNVSTLAGTVNIGGTVSGGGTGLVATGVGAAGSLTTPGFTVNNMNTTVPLQITASASGTFNFGNLNLTSQGAALVVGTSAGSSISWGSSSSFTSVGNSAINIDTAGLNNVTAAVASSTNATFGIVLNNITGSITLNDTDITNATNTGVQVVSGTGTVTFNGDLDITMNGGTGLNVQNAGNFSIQGTDNTVTATAGAVTAAVRIENTTIAASGVTLRSVSSTNATNGILLNGTGTTGTFTVTGTGTTDSSGGIISTSTGDGISLNNVDGVDLRNMDITNGGADGIGDAGGTVTDLVLNNLTISGNGNNVMEAGIRIVNGLLGTCSITDSTITGSSEHNVDITLPNAGQTLTSLTVTGSTFSTPSMGLGADGFLLETRNTASVGSLTFNNCLFDGNLSDHMQLVAADNSSIDVTVTGTTFQNVALRALNFSVATNADLTYDINGNTMTGPGDSGAAVNLTSLSTSTNTSTLSGFIRNNTNISDFRAGISIDVRGDNIFNLTVDNNTIAARRRAVDFISGGVAGDTAAIGLTITNNDLDSVGGTASLVLDILPDITTTLCMNVRGNTIDRAGGGDVISMDGFFSPINLESGADCGGGACANADAHLAAVNTLGGTIFTDSVNLVATGTCGTP